MPQERLHREQKLPMAKSVDGDRRHARGNKRRSIENANVFERLEFHMCNEHTVFSAQTSSTDRNEAPGLLISSQWSRRPSEAHPANGAPWHLTSYSVIRTEVCLPLTPPRTMDHRRLADNATSRYGNNLGFARRLQDVGRRSIRWAQDRSWQGWSSIGTTWKFKNQFSLRSPVYPFIMFLVVFTLGSIYLVKILWGEWSQVWYLQNKIRIFIYSDELELKNCERLLWCLKNVVVCFNKDCYD